MIAPASEPVVPSPSATPRADTTGAEDIAAWRRATDAAAAREALARRMPAAARDLPIRVVLDLGCLPDAAALVTFMDSLRAQVHGAWALSLVRRTDGPDGPDDAQGMADILTHYQTIDPRVDGDVRVLRAPRLHEALTPEAQPLTVLVDQPGRLNPLALAAIAATFNLMPATALAYADEGPADAPDGGQALLIKQTWDSTFALTRDLFGALKAMRSPLAFNACAALRADAGPAWFYAHALRVSEWLRRDEIRHIPERLFERSGDPWPTAERDAAEGAAVTAALARRGRSARVTPTTPGLRRVVPTPEAWPAVTVIIPTHDKVDYLRRIVTGLLNETDYPVLDIIIIDNRSQEPETATYLEDISRHPHVCVLPIDEPFNFARLNNLAALQARGEVLLFLNNDTEVLHDDWLREMAAHAIRPEVGAVGALLFYPDGRIQHAGVLLGANAETPGHLGLLMDADWVRRGPGETERPVSAVTGACLAMRAEVFREMGGFDEHFAVSYNDVDLCLRVGQAGYSIVWTPAARLRHHESVSRGDDLSHKNLPRARREKARLIERWGVTLEEDPLQPPAFHLATPGWVPGAAPRSPYPWLAAR